MTSSLLLLFRKKDTSDNIVYDFTGGNVGDASVSRTTVATYINSSVLLAVAGVDEPIFEYDANGVLRGLRIEPTATNLQTHSLPTTSTWGSFNVDGVLTSSAGEGPDGEATAASFVDTGATNSRGIRRTTGQNYTNLRTYAVSVLAKPAGQNVIQTHMDGTRFAADQASNFNITTGVVGSTTLPLPTQIEASGNGFYRCGFRALCAADGSNVAGAYVILANNNASAARDPAYTGAGTGVLVAGVQIEKDSITSYIPQGATPMTRGADVVSYTAKANHNVTKFTFDDNSTQYMLTGGATSLTVPTNLLRRHLRFIDSYYDAAALSLSLLSGGLNWREKPLKGRFDVVSGITNYLVQDVNGATPSYADLNSFRYHHHTRVAVGENGRLWVAYSGSLSAEDQTGQITIIKSTTDAWSTSVGPTVVIEPPETIAASKPANRRISYPRCFVTSGSALYLVSAIDLKTTTGNTDEVGVALVACECNADGSLGTRYLIAPAEYTPLSGCPDYAYDADLSAALFNDANLFGVWGGSAPAQTQSTWIGYATDDSGHTFVEPSTIAVTDDGLNLMRLWRCVAGTPTTKLFYQHSTDGGENWSDITQTNIPNAPSSTALIRLSDGRIALIGNGEQAGVWRDPLFIGIFDHRTGMVNNVLAIRQGLSGTPAYSNGESGGAQYPAVCEYDGNLYVSYSIAKQTIGLSKFPLTSL